MREQRTMMQMKRLLTVFIVAFLFGFMINGAEVQAAESKGAKDSMSQGYGCPEFKPAKIAIAQFTGRLYQNQSKSSFQIAREKSKKYGGKMPAKIGNMGEAIFRPDIHVNVKTYPGMGCIIVEEIDVRIFVDHFIDIAEEHSEGSCMHTELYGLEIELMQQDEEIINAYLEQYREEMRTGLARNNVYGPVSGADLNGAIVKKKKEIEHQIKSRLGELLALLAETRRDSDLVEYYTEIEQDCTGGMQ